MRKSFYLTALLGTALIPLMAETAFSYPRSESYQYPTVSTLDNNTPVCYMQTPNGKTLELSSICGKVSPIICSGGISSPERQALLNQFCNNNSQCLLTSTCNEIPRPLYIPKDSSPLGFIQAKDHFTS
jgi:hypothetical protein